MKKLVKIFLIIVLALIGFLLSASPLVIVIAVLAVVATIKMEEASETEAKQRMTDDFSKIFEQFVKPEQQQSESKKTPDDSDKYETKIGFFTIKVPKDLNKEKKALVQIL